MKDFMRSIWGCAVMLLLALSGLLAALLALAGYYLGGGR